MVTKPRMIGVRIYGKASALVTYCKALKDKPSIYENAREITHVEVKSEFRNLGMGSKLMREICEEADREKVILLVFPKPYGENGLTTERLVDWYSDRFDFEIVQTEPVIMMARTFMTPEKRATIKMNCQILEENAK